MPNHSDVVILGAGPVGLYLAIELSLAGVRPLVLERLAKPDLTVKAGGVGAVAAVTLERRGFAHAMAAAEREMFAAMSEMGGGHTGGAKEPFRKYGGHFSGLFLIDQTRQRQPEWRMRGVQQSALEAMLSERVQSMGVELRRGEELLDFTQHERGIALQLRNARGPYTLETQYLVGCDGGRSQVRKRAGIEFAGTDATFTGYQGIVELDHPERLRKGWDRTPHGMISYGPTPNRVIMMTFDAPPPSRDVPITHDEVERTLRTISGADVRITKLHQATRWSDNTRQAVTYRKGRVLLAGDAAHVHSPFGGQGLNLGIVDAANLGWKLAATVRGEAPAGLLDSYTTERHPIAAKVLANTRAQTALMRPDPQTSALRDIVAEIMVSDWGTRYFGEMISGVSARYDLGDAHLEVGTLAPERSIGSDTIAALMREGGALLIDGTGRASEVAAPWRTKVRCVRAEGPSQLIRPDGYIAWVGAGTEGLSTALTRWFGA